MAQYDQLPVFLASYELLQEYLASTKNMPHHFRYTIHQDVIRSLTAVMQSIYRANRYRDKAPYIEMARQQLTDAQLQIRLLKDLRCIGLKSFARMGLKSDEVSRQLAGWMGYVQNKSQTRKPEKG